MADRDHLKLLLQGVEGWNQWRKENPEVRPDLFEANLREADLFQANLRGADLFEANLFGANLIRADLRGADLRGADLSLAHLSKADLSKAALIQADLRRAILRETNLSRTNFRGADLRRVDLSRANLGAADLYVADLGAAKLESTVFSDVDLSEVKGLETVEHGGPSYVDIHTLYQSKGKIPEVFLRGVGAPDTFITYVASLTQQAIQYHSCFISYSHKDEAFAQRLHADLQQNNVRCWYAPEDMKIGDKLITRHERVSE